MEAFHNSEPFCFNFPLSTSNLELPQNRCAGQSSADKSNRRRLGGITVCSTARDSTRPYSVADGSPS